MPEDPPRPRPPFDSIDAWWEEANLATHPVPAGPFPSALTRQRWRPRRATRASFPPPDSDYEGKWLDDEAYEMNGTEFTIRLIEALVWPATIVLLFVIPNPLRDAFRKLMQRIQRQADSDGPVTIETPMLKVQLGEAPIVTPDAPPPATLENEPADDQGTWTS